MKYLNFNEFKKEIKLIASPADFEKEKYLLKLVPFKHYTPFKNMPSRGYLMQKAFDATISFAFLGNADIAANYTPLKNVATLLTNSDS